MIISDLNHLEVAEASVVGGFDLGYDYSNICFYENFNLYKNVNSNVSATGHIATVESQANAYGYGTATQVFTSSLTTPTSSSSAGVSISATGR